VLGDFELRAEIGRGGMGTVFEAWQRSLHRKVALKALNGSLGPTSNAVLRFQREAKAAAKLSHPHILPIYAQGQQDGVYYYVMELVAGPGLNGVIAQARQRCGADTAINSPDETVALGAPEATQGAAETIIVRETPRRASLSDSSVLLLPPGEVHSDEEYFRFIARHIASIADALEYAHQRGVIHRDIKPHNLLFCADGRLVVSDFGLARVIEEPGVTVTGEFFGSPLYMSVEQITRGANNVDHRTDIYSLGATMYEWLTLRPPFPGESREQVISRVLHTEAAAPRELNPAVPVDLETICLKAIDKDPARRYQTAAEMRDDLQRFLGSAPIRARRAGLASRARRLVMRHQIVSVLAGALIIALLMGKELLDTREEVKSQATAHQREREENQLVFEEILRSLPPEVKGVAWTLETVAPVVQDVMRRSPANGDGTGGLLTSGPNAAAAGTPAGLARRAAADLYAAHTDDPEADSATPEDPEEQAERRLVTLAEEESDPAIKAELAARAIELHPQSRAAARLSVLAFCLTRDYPRMLSQAEQLVRLREDDPGAVLWRGLANLLTDAPERALADFSFAVEKDGRSAWTRALRGLALLRTGEPDDAMLELTTAVSLEPGLAVAWLGRGAANAAMGRFDHAIGDVTHALELQPTDADAFAIRGEYHAALGHYTEAADDFDEAIRIGGKNAMVMIQLLVVRSRAQQVGMPIQGGSQPGESIESANSVEQSSSTSTWEVLDRIFGGTRPAREEPPARGRFDFPETRYQ
jgi:serine/threonine protein kinase/tetratricopeptide (TPR) repeat protein